MTLYAMEIVEKVLRGNISLSAAVVAIWSRPKYKSKTFWYLLHLRMQN